MHAQQWERRLKTDRAAKKIQTNAQATGKLEVLASATAVAASGVSLELAADASGIGFAFGGYILAGYTRMASLSTHTKFLIQSG